jgi:hypothetical protein
MAYDLAVTEEDFLKFANDIIPLIEKEKITEQLIEKFIERFMLYSQEADQRRQDLDQREQRATEELMEYSPILLTAERECKFLSVCLAHFSYNLANLRRLVQGYDYYRGFLRIEFIFDQFQLILNKCRKYAVTQKGLDSKRRKQSKTVIQGHEMSAAQEYNFLIAMLEENLEKYDKQYHLGKKAVAAPIKKARPPAKRKANRPQPSFQHLELPDNYQIDYTQINRPTNIAEPGNKNAGKQNGAKQGGHQPAQEGGH